MWKSFCAGERERDTRLEKRKIPLVKEIITKVERIPKVEGRKRGVML